MTTYLDEAHVEIMAVEYFRGLDSLDKGGEIGFPDAVVEEMLA